MNKVLWWPVGCPSSGQWLLSSDIRLHNFISMPRSQNDIGLSACETVSTTNLNITFEPLGLEIHISHGMPCEKSFANTYIPIDLLPTFQNK